MSKICTDLEQSRKLVELGLDPNTADMTWQVVRKNKCLHIGYHSEYANSEELNPAWSLSALLELMPKIKASAPILVKALLEEKYYCHYHGIGTFKEVYTTTFHEEPIDAAFEMVVWLLENKHIK